MADPTGKAPTRKVERFQVRPGDCGTNSTWSDCKNDRERSELSERNKETRHGDEYWYAWSLYVPEEWPNIWPTKTSLAQFHQSRSHVIWMFQNDRGGLLLDRQVTGRTDKKYPLLTASQMRGKWNRIEVHARWSTQSDGFFRVYVNGARKADYSGPTMTAKRIYFKYGVYRSFLSRFKRERSAAEVPTQTAYFAAVKRARTRAGVQ